MRTIVRLGGYWVHDILAGITLRDVVDEPPTATLATVASRLIYLS